MSRTTLLFAVLLLYGCILDVYAASVVRLVSNKRRVNITFHWLRTWKIPGGLERWKWGRDYLELLESRTVCFPAVELLISLCLAAVVKFHGVSISALALTVLITTLVIGAAVDHELGIFPDKLSFPLIGSGLIFAVLAWPIEGSAIAFDRILGGVIGFLSVFGNAYLYYLITRRIGLGGGDIKMCTAVGFFLGLKGFLVFIFAFSLMGTISGVFLSIIRRIPFDWKMQIHTGAPYALGVACVLLFPSLTDWHFDFQPRQHAPLAIETINRSVNATSFGAGVRDEQ